MRRSPRSLINLVGSGEVSQEAGTPQHRVYPDVLLNVPHHPRMPLCPQRVGMLSKLRARTWMTTFHKRRWASTSKSQPPSLLPPLLWPMIQMHNRPPPHHPLTSRDPSDISTADGEGSASSSTLASMATLQSLPDPQQQQQ